VPFLTREYIQSTHSHLSAAEQLLQNARMETELCSFFGIDRQDNTWRKRQDSTGFGSWNANPPLQISSFGCLCPDAVTNTPGLPVDCGEAMRPRFILLGLAMLLARMGGLQRFILVHAIEQLAYFSGNGLPYEMLIHFE
jgi:hypothetical protein